VVLKPFSLITLLLQEAAVAVGIKPVAVALAGIELLLELLAAEQVLKHL
jgi:hypothetical protein